MTLKDGMWAGRRCIIGGGGPSLTGFDWGSLRAECWIGINRAWIHDPTIHLILDYQYQRAVLEDPQWRAWPGIKVWHQISVEFEDTTPPDPPKDVILLRSPPARTWSKTLADGLCHGTNTGTSALNLADLLVGPGGRVYLLGYDLRGRGGKTVNWHDDYKWPHTEDYVYDRFREDITGHVRDLQSTVVNISPGRVSTLTCFPIEERLPDPPHSSLPLVVSFASPSYKQHSVDMAASARLVGLDVEIREVPPFRSWQDACKFKPRHILECLERHGRPVLWTDCDSRFRRYPALLDGLGGSVAAHVIRTANGREQPAPGTVWVAPNDVGRAFLRRWIEIQDGRLIEDHLGDVEAFGRAWAEYRTAAPEALIELPGSYCWIFDLHPSLLPNGQPVIEHLQASRVLRAQIDARKGQMP